MADWTARSFAGIASDRLSERQWSGATGSKINDDISNNLATLRARCEFEGRKNDFIKGVIRTHTNDIVGENGPKIQFLSKSDQAFADAAEQSFNEFWKCPDAALRMSGPDMMRQGMNHLWLHGDFFFQKVSRDDVGDVKLRLLPIHPTQVGGTSMFMAYGKSGNTIMGRKLDRFGAIVSYEIQDAIDPSKRAEIPANQMIAGFVAEEAGQVFGVPLLAPALETIAMTRDYRKSVLQAAKIAADLSTFLYTDNADAGVVNLKGGTSMQLQSGMLITLPAGWKPMQLAPQQPGTTFEQFNNQLTADAVRGVCMPQMIASLDASNHNYSSARFDALGYVLSVGVWRQWWTGTFIDQVIADFLKEFSLLYRSPIPDDLTTTKTWPIRQSIDPVKDANAAKIRKQLGLTTDQYECASLGLDYREVYAQLKREREERKEIGIVPHDVEMATLELANKKGQQNEPRV